MKIKGLQLVNWCQHRELTVHFDAGLVGILGPNGSGKSNIIRALVYALTGYTPTNKLEYISTGEKTGSVALEICTDNGAENYKITRAIQNGTVSVSRLNDGIWEVITKTSADARSLIAEMIHISADVACQVFCTPQEDLVSLFRETSAKRNQILQRVFSLQFFERERKKIMEILQTVDQKAAELEARLVLLSDQRAQKEAFLQSFASLPPKQTLEDMLKSLTESGQETAKRLGSVQLRAYLSAQQEKGEAELQMIQERLRDPAPVCEETRSRSDLETQLTLSLQRQAEISSVYKQVSAFLKLAPPEEIDPDELDRLQTQYTDLVAETKEAQKLFDLITGCGTEGRCPTCGAKTSWTEDDLRKAQAHFTEARQKLSELKSYMTLRKQEIEKQARRNSQYASHLEALEQPLASLGYMGVPAEVFPALEKDLTDLDLEVHNLRESLKKVSGHEAAFQAWRQEQERLQTRLEELNRNLQAIQENPVWSEMEVQDTAALEQEQAVINKQIQQVKDQLLERVQYDGIALELEGISQDVLRIRNQLKETDPELRRDLHALADMFHIKAFPAKVACDIYRKLTEKIRIYLTEFNAPFTVEFVEGGDFFCHFDNGTVQLAARLSGGEKMLLSIAFRLALHSVFAQDDTGGFVMLDEPTTFLDSRNRGALTDVLKRLKESPVFSDLQIFIVTHDEMLRPLFNSLVDLGEKK